MESESEDSLADGARVVVLSEHDLQKLIERAAAAGARQAAVAAIDEAQHRFVYQVGIGVLKKAAVVVGIGILIFGLWLAGKDLPR
jgi:hypothetical protein